MTDTYTPGRPPGVSRLDYARKAVVAGTTGALALLGSLTVAVTAGSDGGSAITTPEWLQAAWVGLSAAAGTVGVYITKNKGVSP